MGYRYMISDGIIIDGSGAEPFIGDVIIDDGLLTEIRRRVDIGAGESLIDASRRLRDVPSSDGDESLHSRQFDEIIDARGLVITPGFIDIHTHSDLSIFAAPDASAKILQGVTTDVIGNCAIGPAPLNQKGHEYFTRWRRYESSWLDRSGVNWPVWPKWSDYAERLAEHKKSLNIAGLVAHGAIRASVVGEEEQPATSEQLSEMKTLLREAMESGALGMSTGLTYIPSCYADTAEVTELAEVVAQFDGLYASHIRGEDERLLDAVDEAIEIGRRSGVSIQISHHKVVGRKNWGAITQSLERLNRAVSSGVDAAVDMYPYCFGGTFPKPLWRLLPDELQFAVSELADGDSSLSQVYSDVEGWLQSNAGVAGDPMGVKTDGPQVAWDEVYVVEHCRDEAVGSTVAQLADSEGTTCIDWFVSNLDREDVRIKDLSISPTDLRTVLSYGKSMIGSDTYAMNATDAFSATWLHPRNFGTFARVLRKYVREEGALSWPEAVKMMSSMPASRLGLQDRGLLRENMKADVAVWSAEHVQDRATIRCPFTYAEGFEWVFINGEPVVARGEVTKNRPGVLIRRH